MRGLAQIEQLMRSALRKRHMLEPYAWCARYSGDTAGHAVQREAVNGAPLSFETHVSVRERLRRPGGGGGGGPTASLLWATVS